MAKTRVHDLAKEYGMTSKEMLDHLRDMKIPAKSASSTLEDAYVSIVRKKLKPILEARAAQIEAAKKVEEEAAAEAKKAEEEAAEKERIAAEKRRERERAEEEERNRVHDNAPKSMPTFTSLLDQIAQQEQVLKQQAEEAAQKKAEGQGRRERRGESDHVRC